MAIEFYKGPTDEELARDMAAAVGFSHEDLQKNRSGRMTSDQMLALVTRAWQPFWLAASAMAGWLVCLGVIHMIMPDSVEVSLMRRIWAWKSFGIVLLGITLSTIANFVVSLLQFGRRSGMLLVDMIKGDVTSVQGRVAPSWTELDAPGLGKIRGDKLSIYKYCIRNDEFEVSRSAYDLLINKYGEFRPTIRIYYAPRSRILLSAEPDQVDPVAVQEAAAKWVFRGMDGKYQPPPVARRPPPPPPALGAAGHHQSNGVAHAAVQAAPPLNTKRPVAPAPGVGPANEPGQAPVPDGPGPAGSPLPALPKPKPSRRTAASGTNTPRRW